MRVCVFGSWRSKNLCLRQRSCVRRKLWRERGHWLQGRAVPGPALECCWPHPQPAATAYYGRRPGGLRTCWPPGRISASRCLSRQEVSRQMPELAPATRVAYGDAASTRPPQPADRAARLAGAAVHTRSAV